MSLKQNIHRILAIKKGRKALLYGVDLVCFLLIALLYYFLMAVADPNLESDSSKAYLVGIAVHLVSLFAIRIAFRIYRTVWRYSSTRVYCMLVVSDAIAAVIATLVVYLLNFALPGIYAGFWQFVSVGALTLVLTLFSRFLYSMLYKWSSHLTDQKEQKEKKPAVIVGAGRLGSYLAGDLLNNPNSAYIPAFFIDSDSAKIGNQVAGLRVYAPKEAQKLIEERSIGTVIIAIAKKDAVSMNTLYNDYVKLGCKVRVCETLISENDTCQGKPMLHDFTVEDLLFREPIRINDEKILQFYRGKVVLVTGGGGSIGSEICRQIASCGPRQLIIFDIYENNAYEIQQELLRKYGSSLDLAVEIGSVRDVRRLDQVFSAYRPQVVFHAAAHKHVPLMEHSAAEAVKNNCIGTYNTANAAEKYGVEKFILISTDKAVNPTNIMGASKRVCEMVIQCRADSKTSFAAVRFGNVLGSNGSVIPLFRKQIEEGGPVTVTDNRIIRYFMTIPEASQLVIRSGAMAKKGELFVLDMGKPVKIYDLAVNMIRMMGHEPGKDIEIKEVGLRPGEKLYEELLMKTEEMEKTENNLIFIEHDTPYSRAEVDRKLARLLEAVEQFTEGDTEAVKQAIAEVVPTYRSPEAVNKTAEKSKEMRITQSRTAEPEVPQAAGSSL